MVYISQPVLEEQWAMKAFQHAETYFNVNKKNNEFVIEKLFFVIQLLCTTDPKQLRLSRHDDQVYSRFRELFPDLKVDILDENQIKSNEGKAVNCKDLIDSKEIFLHVALENIL